MKYIKVIEILRRVVEAHDNGTMTASELKRTLRQIVDDSWVENTQTAIQKLYYAKLKCTRLAVPHDMSDIGRCCIKSKSSEIEIYTNANVYISSWETYDFTNTNTSKRIRVKVNAIAVNVSPNSEYRMRIVGTIIP